MESEQVTVSAAAAELGVSHVTLWRYIDAGRLTAKRIGPIYVIDREVLDAFKAKPRPRGRPKGSKNKVVEYRARPERLSRAVAERRASYDA